VTSLLPVAWAALLLTGAWTIRPRPHPRPVLVTSRRAFLRPDVTRTLVGMVGALVLPLPMVPVVGFGAWAVPVVRRRRAALRL
jgi:hypothetical protein